MKRLCQCPTNVLALVTRGRGTKPITRRMLVELLNSIKPLVLSSLTEARNLYARWPRLRIDEKRKIAETLCQKLLAHPQFSGTL